MAWLTKGHAVTMDDAGGAVGLRCVAAARSGRSFSAEAAKRLTERGCVIAGKPRKMVQVGSSTYRLSDPPAGAIQEGA